MKKTVLVLLLLIISGPARPEQNPQILNFLKQLSLRYYCLNREGLRDFSCTMKLSLPPGFVYRFKDQLRRNNIFKGDEIVDALNGVEYQLTVSGGKTKVLASEPASTGDEQADDIVIKEASMFGTLCEQVISIWTESTVKPFYTDEDLVQQSFAVQNGTGGFTVTENDPKGSQETEAFDAQAALQTVMGTSKDTSVSIHTGYAPTAKGYLLESWDLAAGEVTNHSTITYGVVDRYWLPQKWTFHFLVPGALAEEDEFNINFSDYQVNQEGKDTAFVHLLSRIAAPDYHYDSGIAQIENLDKHYIPSRNIHELGVTNFQYKWGTDFAYEAKSDPGGATVKIWVSKVYVLFLAPKLDVYVADQYAPGSCAYQAILDHENTHVAIDQKTFAKYQGIILQAFEADPDIPTAAHPWRAKSIKAGKAMVKQHLDGILNPLVKKFWAEMGLQNGRIDLPDSYARVHAKCKDW